MASNAERQRRHKARMAAAGLVQVAVWVPAGAVAEVNAMAEALRIHRHLIPGPLFDSVSGKLVSLRKAVTAADRAAAAAMVESSRG